MKGNERIWLINKGSGLSCYYDQVNLGKWSGREELILVSNMSWIVNLDPKGVGMNAIEREWES